MASSFRRADQVRQLGLSIERYKPPAAMGRSPLILGVFGSTGAGKSSVINSMLSLFRSGQYESYAQVGAAQMQGGMTVMRDPYHLTDYIKIVDNRGMDDLNKREVMSEVMCQVDGKRGYGIPVEWGPSKAFVKGEIMHITILVVDGSREYDSKSLNNGKELVRMIQIAQGRTPLAIITHVDVAAQRALKSTHRYLEGIGIGVNDIYEVENVKDQKMNLKDTYKVILLEILQRSINDCKIVLAHRSRRLIELEQLRLTDNNYGNGGGLNEKDEQPDNPYDRAGSLL